MSTFTGRVKIGLGRGAKFIAIPTYNLIFQAILKGDPFHGTLNLEISPEASNLVTKNLLSQGKKFENLTDGNNKLGDIITLNVILSKNNESIFGCLVRPILTSHLFDTVEIVSSEHLRDYFSLDDGDTIDITILD